MSRWLSAGRRASERQGGWPSAWIDRQATADANVGPVRRAGANVGPVRRADGSRGRREDARFILFLAYLVRQPPFRL